MVGKKSLRYAYCVRPFMVSDSIWGHTLTLLGVHHDSVSKECIRLELNWIKVQFVHEESSKYVWRSLK
uniref:Ovule protein n=1 Tax=Panagrellus redivivus TaxID=6233 RepID=A0A7E4W3A6_PANRE